MNPSEKKARVRAVRRLVVNAESILSSAEKLMLDVPGEAASTTRVNLHALVGLAHRLATDMREEP